MSKMEVNMKKVIFLSLIAASGLVIARLDLDPIIIQNKSLYDEIQTCCGQNDTCCSNWNTTAESSLVNQVNEVCSEYGSGYEYLYCTCILTFGVRSFCNIWTEEELSQAQQSWTSSKM